MSWREKPTMLSTINKKYKYIFTDESGYIQGVKKLKEKIINHEPFNIRNDSLFMLNSVYVRGNIVDKTLFHLNTIKTEIFGNISIVLHSTDIHNKKKQFTIFQDEKTFKKFGNYITEYLAKSKFIQLSTAINKVNYLTSHLYKDSISDDIVINYIYSTHIIKICKLLKSFNQRAILVFESTDKKLDKKILGLVLRLKNRGTKNFGKDHFSNIKAVYFTNKQSKVYCPFGEICDLTCRPVYNYFLNIEFQSLLPKFFNYPHKEIYNCISIINQ